MSEPLLNPGEAAELLGVDKRTLGRYVDKGILHPVSLPSGQHRYRREELNDWQQAMVLLATGIRAVLPFQHFRAWRMNSKA